ncbi:MAG: ATP-binding protein [Bacteriovorax sp.]|nr:ATP-binding protein [Bacteriovorax sp.]
MNSWTTSFISAKKVITSFSLVCLVLSIPIFYLLYVSFIDYESQHQLTQLEIEGNHIVGNLLLDFSLLSVTNYSTELEKGKKEIKEVLITKNVLNLSIPRLREGDSFFYERKKVSNQLLAQDYYGPIIRFVANSSSFVLDPDPDSYYFMDVLVFRLPRIYSILANAHEGEEVAAKKSLRELRSVFSEIDYSLKTAVAENKERLYRTRYNFPHDSNFFSVTDEVDSQISGIKKVNLKDIVLKLQVFQKDIIQDVDGILLNRNQKLQQHKNFILMGTLGFWLFGIISGFFLFVKILKDQREMLKRYSYQNKQLEESEKLSFVGQLASSIAHEVKNPLTIIDFEASSVRKNLNSEQFDKERAFSRLTKISEMSARINKISNLITVFTRKSSGDPFENIPFKKILDDTLYLTQLKASKFNISIKVTPLECDLCCRVIELEQVLINIVNNAIDAIEPLSERWIKILPALVEKEGEQWIVIRITDSGTGIKKEVLKNMFDSFYTTKPSGKGTGLGLSISLKIIENHRGKIYYDEHSEHTSFVVEIPRVQPLV